MTRRVRSWERSDRTNLFEHRLFDLYQDEVSAGADRRSVVVMDPPDWVNVIPVLEKRYVLMVRQWRHGVERSTLEIPGGMIEWGERESPREAAARELATDLEQVAPDTELGVGREELELEVVPLGSVSRLISSGEISHSLVVAAFHLMQVHDL